MTELERLEMLVKHYENKEKKLIEFIENEIDIADEKLSRIENYNLKTNWVSYRNALKLVLEKIYKLERVKD